ncbi:hypothetical protein ACFQXB_16720 [Plastorhodobacter daqingensis]|uniref:Lipoprotein n=1 Tax=Plastorhodobacter daqingensis TaxID=1387281 RepID=A0ABW2UPA4_9RHOB
MRLPLTLCLVAPLALAACSNPRERCINAATEELRVVNALVAETETNLDRGYTLIREPGVRTGLHFCLSPTNPFTFCSTAQPTVTDRPTAIDIRAEERKLAQLRAKQNELTIRAASSIAACEQQHPRR